MAGLQYVLVLACTFFVHQADGGKTYRDMFPHKHAASVKFPPIPGWSPDSNPWDEYLYPPFGPKPGPVAESGPVANPAPLDKKHPGPKPGPFGPFGPWGPFGPFGPKPAPDTKLEAVAIAESDANAESVANPGPLDKKHPGPKPPPFGPFGPWGPYGPYGPNPESDTKLEAVANAESVANPGPLDKKHPKPKPDPFGPFGPWGPFGPFGPKPKPDPDTKLEAVANPDSVANPGPLDKKHPKPKPDPFGPFGPWGPYGPFGPKPKPDPDTKLEAFANSEPVANSGPAANPAPGPNPGPFGPFGPIPGPWGPYVPFGPKPGPEPAPGPGPAPGPFGPYGPMPGPFGPFGPFGPKPPAPPAPPAVDRLELTRRKGKPVTVRLTSDSPAINGSMVSFTAKLEYPKCQKEDANGDLVWDEKCDDANGQVGTGYVFNWTSWLDDYGFGECKDLKSCNVFPDGKPFPQSNDWRHKGYVYVWHTMGQYFETCDGSSSTLSFNTSGLVLGAEMMEVMVYRKRERRKYSPLSTDNTVFFVTDKIPLAVNISQKAAANLSSNVFVRGEDVVFDVKVHDPSDYLKTAAAVDYIWDFKDGNQLVTHSNVATHAYSTSGDVTVKLTIEAAFRIECPAAAPTPSASVTSPPTTAAPTAPPGTHAITPKMETTQAPLPSTTQVPATTGMPTTEPLPPTEAYVTPGWDPTPPAPVIPSALALTRFKRLSAGECFRYLYGNYQTTLTIVEPKPQMNSQPTSRIVDVSAAKVTNTDISFLVKCLGGVPTSACTIVSDPTCRQVRNIVCDDVPPSSGCEVRLRRTFLEPGTYCVNITLEDATSLALASTTVTIGNAPDTHVASKTPSTAAVVLSSSAVLAAIFAFIAFMVYKRYRVYRPVRRALVEDASGHNGVGGRIGRLRDSLFPTNEESRHLLPDRHPL